MDGPATRLGRARQRIGKRIVKPEPGIRFAEARPFLPERPVIIEAGAWNGGDIPEMLQTWHWPTIHAFEPEPGSYRALVDGFGTLPQVQTWPLALGTEDGTATLHVSHNRYGTMSSSLLAPAGITTELEETTFSPIEVQLRSLDSWAAENGVDHVDLLALDMQGYEYAALDASRDLLRSARVVISEAYLGEMYEGAATVDQFQRLLTSEGFVILRTNTFFGTTLEILAVHRRALETAFSAG